MTEYCTTCSNGHIYAPGYLHEYQEVARDFLRGRDEAGLFLDMGLGKTASVLSALEPRHLPVLVLAPKRVAETVWDVEAGLWRPDLTVAVAAGSPAERARQIGSGSDIVVISRDNQGDILKGKSPKFKTLVIDELSGYKGRGVRYKQARQISATTDYTWGLTGTPAPNGLLNLWPQMAILDGGARLGKNITTYRSRYFLPGRQLPNGTIIEWNLREGAERKIYDKLEDIVLAMATEGRVALPEVTYNMVQVALPDASRKIYRKIANDLLVDLNELLGIDTVHTAANAALLTSKLSQICAGFMYEDPVYEDLGETDILGDPVLTRVNEGAYSLLNSAKIDALSEIVEESQGSPILVAYRFQVEKDMILKTFKKARSIDEPGVIKDWNAGKVPMLVAHPASAGHGLNLQHGGHTIVWTSLDWDLELWDQFNKRLLRQGQKNAVVINILAVDRSVDHLIRARLTDKAIDQGALLEYLESPL